MSKRPVESRDRKSVIKKLKSWIKKLRYPFYGGSLILYLLNVFPIAATVLMASGVGFVVILGTVKLISIVLGAIEEWIPQWNRIRKSSQTQPMKTKNLEAPSKEKDLE